MSKEKPIVFVIDDDPSIRAALSRLFRAVARHGKLPMNGSARGAAYRRI